MGMLDSGPLVLFQGDSITDCNRMTVPCEGLGRGYAMMVASMWTASNPESDARFVNRGLSGNRTLDLAARWKEDCLDIHPDCLSILVGVNDTWRHFSLGETTSSAQFTTNYRSLIDQAKGNVHSPSLVLCEPFLLEFSAERKDWMEDLEPKIEIVRALAREHRAILVPFQSIFDEAAKKRPPEFWCPDGVHLSQAWLNAVQG